MTTYYVGIGGNDGNSGLTWALRKLTLNGAEDIPLIAGDTVIVGAGTYREILTVDVSGGLGFPITYIGDTYGILTDGVGGIARITGSNNDLTAVRAYCVDASAAQRTYRTFRGFHMDTVTNALIYGTNGPDNWLIEDCTFNGGQRAVWMTGASSNITIRRCLCQGHSAGIQGAIELDGVGDNRNILIENCVIGFSGEGILIDGSGGVTVRNCYLHNNGFNAAGAAVRSTNLNAGQFTRVYNSIIVYNYIGLSTDAVGEFDEDYNQLFGNNTDRATVGVGGNSVGYTNLVEAPLLYSGQGQVSGFAVPWWPWELSEWHQCVQWGGTNPPSHDMFGMQRPTTAGKRSIGPIQFQQFERDTSLVYGDGISSLLFNDAGRFQLWIAHNAATMQVELYTQRGGTYAGTLPQMVIKQPERPDRTTTDTGAASAWNLLTDWFTPATLPQWYVIEMVSDNTAAGPAGIAVNFDEVTITDGYVSEDVLLKEDGDRLLLETGDGMLIEQ